jgi:hypothetical protein
VSNNPNPVESLSASIYNALYVTLGEQEYESRDFSSKELKYVKKTRHLEVREIDVVMFPQMWGSTALGFGGLGGQAITTAYTVVISHGRTHVVYFNGRFAYKVERPNELFYAHVKNQDMLPVKDYKSYETT